jgi:hypothetical protein
MVPHFSQFIPPKNFPYFVRVGYGNVFPFHVVCIDEGWEEPFYTREAALERYIKLRNAWIDEHML